VGDAIECSLGGVDWYNNTYHDNNTYYSGTGNYFDGFHLLGNGFLRIYNNDMTGVLSTTSNRGNSCIRIEPYERRTISNVGNILIFNNVFHEDSIIPFNDQYFRGIELAFTGCLSDTIKNVYIVNNTFDGLPFFTLGVGFDDAKWTSGTVKNIVIENNIFKNFYSTSEGSAGINAFNSDGDGTISWGNHGSGETIIFDYNLFYSSGGIYGNAWTYNGHIGTYSEFKSEAYGNCNTHDNGSPVNPLLESDYSLPSNSPAVNKGVDLSSLYSGIFNVDKNGVDRVGTPDIGATEYTGTANDSTIIIYLRKK
jgi:hypothetical protein